MNTTNATVIEVKNLVKHYGTVHAVDGISFAIRQGEIFGMLGPNGAGKTTTIECIEGLRTHDEGSLQVLGLDPHKDAYPLKERIGIQFQSAALPDRIKVWEALDLFSSFYQKKADWKTILKKMGLEEKKNDFVSKLSGGQKQRVFIGLALVNDPEVLFLDELTTGLDPQARRAMWDLVREIRDQGKTIYMTTHFMEEAERLCDRVAIVDHGKLVAMDTPQNLIESLGEDNRIVFEVSEKFDIEKLRAIAGVSRVETMGERVIVYGKKEGLVGRVVGFLEKTGVAFSNLHSEQPNLEDVFLKLTGTEIRN
jgi:ABC-2 type transport system ATP-binding protein